MGMGNHTTYTITNDRISPTADQVTEQGLRDYLADMNESGDWDLDLDTLTFEDENSLHASWPCATIELDGQRVIVAVA